MARLASPRRPLTGETVDAEFTIEFPPGRFRKLAELPPANEGRIGRDYLLEALEPGDSKVTIRLMRGQSILDAFEYRLVVEPRS